MFTTSLCPVILQAASPEQGLQEGGQNWHINQNFNIKFGQIPVYPAKFIFSPTKKVRPGDNVA